MKYIITVLILLAGFAVEAQKKIIVATKNGENFKAWVNGQEITNGFVTYAEKIVPGDGSYSLLVEVQGVAEKFSKSIGFAEDWTSMRWYIKQGNKGKWDIKLDLMYTDGTENASAGFDSPDMSTPSKNGGIKFSSLFIDMGTHAKNEVFYHTIDIESKGDDPLVISDVTTSKPYVEVVDYPKTGIPVGHFGKIKLKVTVPLGESGRQVEKVVVDANTFMGKDNVNIEFEVSDQVAAPVQVEKPVQVETQPISVTSVTPPAIAKPEPVVVKEVKVIKHNPTSIFTCICEFNQVKSTTDANNVTLTEYDIHIDVMDKESVYSTHNFQISHSLMKNRIIPTIGFRDESNAPKTASKVDFEFQEQVILEHILAEGRLTKICRGSYTITSK